jgi:hypothetical protein
MLVSHVLDTQGTILHCVIMEEHIWTKKTNKNETK